MSRRTHLFAIARPPPAQYRRPARSRRSLPFTVTELANFDVPWAMAFLPDGRLLVTEQRGALKLYTPGGASVAIRGVPEVSYGGQGGFSDVVLHPDFARNGLVYLSYAEAGDGDTRGAAVARAKLALGGDGGELRTCKSFGGSRRRSTAAGITAIASRSATATCGSAPATARNSIRRRT